MSLINSESGWFEKNQKKTILFLVMILITLIELFLRLFFPSNLVSNNEIVLNKDYYKNYKSNIEFITYPGIGDSFKPTINRINSIGIRGPELKEKNNYRILNIGDSFIQADEVVFENTFGEKLNQSNIGIEFISHGISSWAPTTEFSWIFHNLEKVKVDEVNLFLFINDFYRKDIYNGDEFYRSFANYSKRIPVSYNIKVNSIKNKLRNIYIYKIFAFAKAQLKGFYRKESFSRKDELVMLSKNYQKWDIKLYENVIETLNVLKEINKFLITKDVKFNVLFVPQGFAWEDEVIGVKMHPDYNWPINYKVSQSGIENLTKTFLKNNKIPFIDLKSGFDSFKKNNKDLLYNGMDGHWNKKGHFVVYSVLKNHYVQQSINK